MRMGSALSNIATAIGRRAVAIGSLHLQSWKSLAGMGCGPSKESDGKIVAYAEKEKRLPDGVVADKMPQGARAGTAFKSQKVPEVVASLLEAKGATNEYTAYKSELANAHGLAGWCSDKMHTITEHHRPKLREKGLEIFYCMVAAGFSTVFYWYWVELKDLDSADPTYLPMEECVGYEMTSKRPKRRPENADGQHL